jgi:hypothetical protein
MSSVGQSPSPTTMKIASLLPCNNIIPTVPERTRQTIAAHGRASAPYDALAVSIVLSLY